MDDDFGEVDNDDLIYDQPQKKPQQRHLANQQQDDEFEYFEEDIEDTKKPFELPRIDNKSQNPQVKPKVSKQNSRLQEINKNKEQIQQNDEFWEQDDDYEAKSQYTNAKRQNQNQKQITNQQKQHLDNEDDDVEFMDDEEEQQQPVSKNPNKDKINVIGGDISKIKNGEDDEEEEGSYYEEYNYDSEEEKQKKTAPKIVEKQQPKPQVPQKQQQQDQDPDQDEYDDENDFEDDQFEADDDDNVDQSGFTQEQYDNDQSRVSQTTDQRQTTSRPPVNRKPHQIIAPKQSYTDKYAKLIQDVDYTGWNDKQLIKENNELRLKLKEISEEVSRLVEKASTRPPIQEKREVSLANKIKILKEELRNNQKRLELQQSEISKIKTRIGQVSSPKYTTDLVEEIRRVQKLIEEKKKKNRQDQLDQNKKGKNLDQIENVAGNPDNLIDKQKKAIELDQLERRNITLQEIVAKLRADIEDNQQKLPAISKTLQEKIDQAVKLKIDVDPDQPMTKMREKYQILDRKKIQLEKHLELIRSKEGKVQVAEHEVKELRKQIQQKDGDINLIEMQILDQRRQVEDARSKLPENKFKLFLPASQTQQHYNVNENPQQVEVKSQRKLVSAKPTMQSKPPVVAKQTPQKGDNSPKSIVKPPQYLSQKHSQPIAEAVNEETFNHDKKDTNRKQQEEEIIDDISDQPKQIQSSTKVQEKNIEKAQPSQPVIQEQQQVDPPSKKLASKPFSLKSKDKQPQEPVQDKNLLTFGQIQEEPQFVLGGSKQIEEPIKKDSPKFVLGNGEQEQVQPRRMMRMAKKPDDNKLQENGYQSNMQSQQLETKTIQQEPQQFIQPQTQQNQPIQAVKSPIQQQQVIQQSEQPVKEQPSQQSYGMPGYGLPGEGAQVPTRRNRLAKQSDQTSIGGGGYDPFSRQSEGNNSIPESNVKNNSIQESNVSNLSKQEQNTMKPFIQQQPKGEENQFILNQQPQQEQRQFNFNKQPTQEQPQQPVQQVQQPVQQPAQKRNRGGPRKLDLWADEPVNNNNNNADVFNIKSLDDEPKQQSQPQQKTQVKPQQQVEEDREMTLEEILAGGQQETHKPVEKEKENVVVQNKRNNKPQQISQAEKQKLLLEKAENDEFFGEFEV